MKFGQRLRELRRDKGISLRALADRIGINFTYLCKLETSALPRPRDEIILALARTLDADPDELFGLAGKVPPDISRHLNFEMIKGLRSFNDQHLWIVEPLVLEIGRIEPRKATSGQEKFFQALIEGTSEGIAVMDKDLVVFYYNPSALRIIGYESELTGRDMFKLFHPEDMSKLGDLVKSAKGKPGEPVYNKIRIKRKDGIWRLIENTCISLLHDPRVNGILIIFRDITSLREENASREDMPLAMAKEYKLTESEHKVLMLMAEGWNNPQIAERLVLSTSTVRFHVSNILFKLGATNRTKAVALATQRHLIV